MWYQTGTVTTVNGSASVVGVGTAWLGQVNAGDLFTVDRVTFYKVATVASDGSLALATPYGGASAADQIYGIVLNFDTASVNFLSAAVALLTPTDRVTAVFGRSGAVTAQAGDYAASQVSVVPAGGIAATEVQGALAELDAEKAALAGATFTGTLTLAAGTTAAAPLVLQSGALLSVPVEGAVEFDGNSVYVGIGCCDTERKTLAFTDSDITGDAANVTGIVAIDHGGTGAATASGALINLGAAPLASPALTGIPTAPTAGVGDSSSQLATTAYVKSQNYITLAEVPVQSVAGRIGAVTLAVTDVSGAAPLSSPNFVGTPTGPTASPADASNHLATTAFVKSLGYITASSAPVQSVAGKTGVVTLDVADVAGAAPLASPALTGMPSAPTAAAGTNTTQLATTAFVKAQTLNDLAAPTAALSINGQRLVNVGDPTGDQDAATKAYVDSVAQGLDAKASVRAATTAAIVLADAQTVDGVALEAGDRVLVKNQTDPAENGIYDVAPDAWVRSADANSWNELVSAFVFVEDGAVNANAGFTCTVQPGGTLGTTPVTWVQFSGAGQVIAGTGLLKDGNTLSVDTSVIAALASPAFTGTPTAPTAGVDTDTTQLATTGFVVGQGYLKTATAAATYAPLAGATFTGTVLLPDGTGTAPALAFANATDTGLYLNSPTQHSAILTAGSGGPTNVGGAGTVQGGPGGATSGDGGNGRVFGGTPVDGNGGRVVIAGRDGATTTATNRDGGSVTLTAGNAVLAGNGGDIVLTPGTSPSGTAGSVQVAGPAAFSVSPTAPTPATPDNSTTLATTAFVKAQGYVTAVTAPVLSVAGRTGNVTLAVGDVSGAAPLASPALTGTPTGPTAAVDTSTTQLATTAYVTGQGYLKSATAAATYAPLASPTFTGVPVVSGTAPELRFRETDQTLPAGLWRWQASAGELLLQKNTAAAGDFSTLVTPLWVNNTGSAVSVIGFTTTGNTILGDAAGDTVTVNGTTTFVAAPSAPTAAVDTNTTQVATTAFVIGQGYLKTVTAAATYAPLASPVFTGTPAAPTAATSDNSTTLATTAFVKNQGYVTAATAPVQSVAGKTGAVTLVVGDVSGAAPLASPALTGTPTAPTPATSDNSTKIATTAFVKAQGTWAGGVSFLAIPSSNIVNATGDGTQYTIVADSEVFDTGNCYNPSTGTFTAPVTGRYLFTGVVYLFGLSSAHTGCQLTLVMSNLTSILWQLNPYAMSALVGGLSLPYSVIVNMDAGDTARLTVMVNGGSKTVNVSGTNPTTRTTTFSGVQLP